MNIGVTGASGFIGSHLIARLSTSGVVVETLDRHYHNLTQPVQLQEFVRRKDAVVHLAGLNRAESTALLHANVVGTLGLVEALALYGKAGARLVFASSVQVYGQPGGTAPIIEETEPQPSTVYGYSKWFAEKLIHLRLENSVILRMSNVYGPWCRPFYNSVVATFVHQSIRGVPLKVTGDGSQRRDFIFVDDVVEALMATAATSDLAGTTFNIASGVSHSLRDLVAAIGAALGRQVEVHYGLAPNAEPDLQYDISQAAGMLDWAPRFSFKDGIRATVVAEAARLTECE